MGRKSRAEIAELYTNIGKVITSSIELDDVLDGIMQEVRGFFDPENWSLMRYDEATSQLYFLIIEGVDHRYVEKITLDLGQGVAGYAAKKKQPVLVNDTASNRHFTNIVDQATGFRTDSIIAVPCIRHGKVYGVIELVNQKVKSFSDEDLVILKTIADYAAIAFENAMLYENALNRSLTDPLTGLFNHTKMSDLLEESGVGQDRRSSDRLEDFLVVYMDCNNFKMINDTYGHREGDRLLKRIASSLKKTFRDNDIIIRIGGDEFVSLIHIDDGTETGMVKKLVAERLDSLKWMPKRGDITVSLSYGFSSGKFRNLKKLLHDADVEMYRKKDKRKTRSG
ncbi:MAG: diguanylate cyclase [Spirochaetota bacterium]